MSFFNLVITQYLLGEQKAQALPVLKNNGR